MRTQSVLRSVVVVSLLVAACVDNVGDTLPGTGGSTGMGGSSGGTAPSGGSAGTSVSGSTATGGSATGGAGTGGTGVTGGTGFGGAVTGGTGGAATGGSDIGGAGVGGAATGGSDVGGAGTGSGTGGTATGGTGVGGAGAGGAATGGTAGGVAGKGGTGGSGGSVANMTGPCDIYATSNPATACVAAYSTTRRLLSTYTGPLYQVRKGGQRTGTGGTTQDIGIVAGGFADGPAQDAFCGTETCTVSRLYDQSGRGNNLTVAPAGCYTGTASEPDYESNAKGRSLNMSGHKVYALYMNPHDGYRNNTGTGMPTGTAAQGVYEVADGKRIGTACCWNLGNASKNNCYGPTGSMGALYFGTGYWGKGAGSGPWFMGDFEAGVWSGGSGPSTTTNNNLPSSNVDYAFGILKISTNGSTPQYAIRVGNAQSGSLTTAYDGQAPATWQLKGGIILGIGGDNSNSSLGTFFEGAVTAGRPSEATDAAVLQNVQAAGYGR